MRKRSSFGDFEGLAVEQFSELIISPGLPLDDPLVKRASTAGVSVIGDIELFYRHATAPIIAITGSNGKSSVVTLVTEILQASGFTAYCGGNIGVPALDLLAKPTPDFYVLEVSSFQLETVDSFAPRIAALLNVSPDHMDRYACFEDYVAAKLNIFRRAENCVLNRAESFGRAVSDQVNVVSFGGGAEASGNYRYVLENEHLLGADNRKIPLQCVRLKGGHSIENALAAMAITDLAGATLAAQEQALSQFGGLEHRTEHVGEWDGVTWINDSKGTNVGATLAALTGSVESSRGVLIAGGVGKGADFSVLRGAVRQRAKAVIVFGQDAGLIADAIGEVKPVYFAQDLAAAVTQAKNIAGAGDTVLFSPACASFDMFANYQQRGEVFKRLVREAYQG